MVAVDDDVEAGRGHRVDDGQPARSFVEERLGPRGRSLRGTGVEGRDRPALRPDGSEGRHDDRAGGVEVVLELNRNASAVPVLVFCHPEPACPERNRMGGTSSFRERQRGNAQTEKAN